MGQGRGSYCGSEGRCVLFEAGELRIGNWVFKLLGCKSTTLRLRGILTGK